MHCKRPGSSTWKKIFSFLAEKNFLFHRLLHLKMHMFVMCKVVSAVVSTIFHPANHPIDFLKSVLFGFSLINLVRVAVRVRVGVRFGLVT
jgi:hypothetical protein